MSTKSLAHAFGFLLALSAGYAEPVLTGIMMLPEGLRFCLIDDETGEHDSPTAWLALGGVFQGFKLEAFDHEKEVLVLRRGNQVKRVMLREAKIEPLEEPTPHAGIVPVETVEDLADVPNDELHGRGLHRIGPGDTLDSISQQTGVPVQQIQAANKALSPRDLTVGRILSLRPGVVPPQQPQAPVAPPVSAEPAPQH